MADRGLRAYAVPSARAGQRPDPAVRREVLAGLVGGGFLVAILAVVLVIVIATPQYAQPAPAGAALAVAGSEPTMTPTGTTDDEAGEGTTSPSPDELTGYRWPVRGGTVARFYQFDKGGQVEIAGRRVHDGLLITWFEGARVKAAHDGTVVAVGRDWIEHVGYAGSVDKVRKSFDRRAAKLARKTGEKPEKFPMGIVIDDGNGYRSVYTEIKNPRVKQDDEVAVGDVIAEMASGGGVRYRLVRMDGSKMSVAESDRNLGYPKHAHERVDPLAVLKTDRKKPARLDERPKNPPRLSDY